jgi:hypothetical protein
VSLGTIAAQHETRKLADVRAELTEKINVFLSPVRIPLIGVAKGRRDTLWTFYLGELPHSLLSWVLTLFWVVLLLAHLV